MGFVKRVLEVEDILGKISVDWTLLKDNQYKKLMSDWKESFEELIINNRGISGSSAIKKLEAHLPIDVYVFNSPNYKYLPVKSAVISNTFAYYSKSLKHLERDEFNQLELIICDFDFSFTCLFNHEAPAWIPESYYEIP